MLIDSHCHLDRLDFSTCGGSVAAALDAARARGVSGFLCVGVALEQLPGMMEIVDAHKDVYASAGVHPLEDMSEPLDVQALKNWSTDDRIIAIGETGLDYFYAKSTVASQRESFITHLDIASDVDKPVIVHTRDAGVDTLAILKEYAGAARGVLHCFADSWDIASRAIDLGFYISLSGIVTFNNAKDLREVAKKIPLDRLLVETDSPYLAPAPFRGKPNQPAYVYEVANRIAALRNVPVSLLAEKTTENFWRLFS